MGILADTVTTLSGEYNYFDPQLWKYIDLTEIFRKFIDLTPMAIFYALLNGFYEEFFFLGLLTSVKDKYKWWVLLYSTIIRVSFHTYQGMLWALTIGVGFGIRRHRPCRISLAFLPRTCSCRYVWVKSDVCFD